MKLLKRISITLTTLFLLLLTFATILPVSAQTQQNLMVAVTAYKPQQNLDFFFSHSVYPLSYLEVKGETPVFVSIITPEQKTEYEKAGYTPTIVDENAGDLNQYYIMSTYHNNSRGEPNIAAKLQNPEYKQLGLELAHQLTTYNTLLKVSKGRTFSQLQIPALQILNARQIHATLKPPTGRVSADLEKAPVQNLEEKPNNSNMISMYLFWLIPLAVIATILLSNRRRTNIELKSSK